MGYGGDPGGYARGAADALAQHKTPNQQPKTAADAVGADRRDGARAPCAWPRGSPPMASRSRRHLPSPRDRRRKRSPKRSARRKSSSAGRNSFRAARSRDAKSSRIVPNAEVKEVVKDPPPPSGSYKVQNLVGGDYVRVWINRAGNHYLIYLPTGAPRRRQSESKSHRRRPSGQRSERLCGDSG